MSDHLIRTTMRPDLIVQVNDQELEDLRRMGVVAALVPFSLDQVPAPIQIPREVETDGSTEEDHGAAAPEATRQ